MATDTLQNNPATNAFEGVDLLPFGARTTAAGSTPKAALADQFAGVDLLPFGGGAEGSPLDQALALEGVSGPLAAIARSVYQQESGGGRNTKTSNAGARGGMQIIPATFASVADQGWNIDDPVHNARSGVRYLAKLFELAGGDPALTAAGYYGGPGALEKARQGIAVSDPRNPQAPNTLQYGQQVAGRLQAPGGMGHTGAAAAGSTEPAPARRETFSNIQAIEPPKSRTALGVANDTVIELANAAAGGVKAAADFISPGSRLSGGIDQFIKSGEAAQTDAVKADKARFRAGLENSTGVSDDLAAVGGYLASSPLQVIAQAAGSFVGPGLAVKGARGVAALAGVGTKGLGHAGLTGGAAAGAVLGGGDAAGTAYDLVMQTPDDVLSQNPQVASLLQAGMALPDVRAKVATEAARQASVIPAVIGAGSGLVGAERILAGVGRAGGKKIISTGLVEGTGEAIEEGVTQYEGQRAAQAYNPAIDPTKNVAAMGAMGAAMGGITGAGIAAISPAQQALNQRQAEIATLAASAKPGNSALTRAAVAGNTGAAAEAEFLAQFNQAAAGEQQATNEQAAVAEQAANEANPAPVADPLAERTRAVVAQAKTQGTLDALRAEQSPVQVKQFVNDLAIAQSTSARADLREQALSRLEYASEWASANPAASVASGIEQTVLPETETLQASEATAAPAPTADLAQASALLRGNTLTDVDRATLTQGLAIAGNPTLPATTRQAARQAANEVMGRHLAPTASAQAQAPAALTAPAPAPKGSAQEVLEQARRNEDSAAQLTAMGYPKEAAEHTDQADLMREEARVREQEVTQKRAAVAAAAIATAEAPGANVPAPRVATPAGAGTAILRKRRATLTQLIEGGLNKVERRHDGQFYLVNENRRRQFKLDGPADAQLARKALQDAIAAGASQANTAPTEAQVKAGNYKKGRVEFDGLKLGIENPIGSERKGTAPDGSAWSVTMTAHYGDLTGTTGADGDGVDTYLVAQPRPGSPVFVVDQYKDDGSFDEHKAILGAGTEAQAVAVYDAHFSDGSGPRRRQAVTAMTAADFKAWAQSSAAKKPAGPSTAATAANDATGIDIASRVGRAAPESITIRMNGQAKEVRLVQPAVANADAGARAGNARLISPANAGALTAVGEAFGTEVSFFQDAEIGDGFVDPTRPGEIFLNENSSIHPLAVFGHEFWHHLETDMPAVHAAVMAVVGKHLKPEAAHQFRNDYYRADAGPNANSALNNDEMREISSDIGGNLMLDGKFWVDVFAQVEANTPGKSKGIIAKLAAYLDKLINQLLASVKQKPFDSTKLVSDLGAVRAAFKDGMAQYILANGIGKAGMQAEILKATQASVKSEARMKEDILASAERAGFDRKVWYHGTITKDFKKFKAGKYGLDELGDGIYFTGRPEYAQSWAGRPDMGGRIIPVLLKKGDFFDLGAKRDLLALAKRIKAHNPVTDNERKAQAIRATKGVLDWTPEESRIVNDTGNELWRTWLLESDQDLADNIKRGSLNTWLARAGYIGAINKNSQIPDQVVVFDAQNIRSPWAKFNPKKADSADILASSERLPAASDAVVDVGRIPGAKLNMGTLTLPVGSREAANHEMARIGSSVRFSAVRESDALATAYAKVEAKYKGTDQWLKAPDGSTTELTERQWVHVRTPAFKAWFGDWEQAYAKGGVWSDYEGRVSKAVGANGEPLVVYHGSDEAGFTEFKRPGGEKRGDLGIFTTSNVEMAESYVKRGRAQAADLLVPIGSQDDLENAGFTFEELDDGRIELTDPDGYDINGPADSGYRFANMADAVAAANQAAKPEPAPGVYALFINVRKPNESDFEGANWDGTRSEQWQVEVGGEVQSTPDGKQYFTEDEAKEFAKEFANPDDADQEYDATEDLVVAAADHYETTDSVIREARRYKNDGSIIRNVKDEGGGRSRYAGEPSDVFVAFEPNQLKSADFNNGSYGVGQDDVRFSKKRESNEIDVAKPSSKVAKAEALLAGIDEDQTVLYHSGDASLDAQLADGIEPGFGGWLDEVLAGATDSKEAMDEIREQDPIAFYSETPNWVSMKVARAAGKSVRDVTLDDLRQHGQLGIVIADKEDRSIWRADEDGQQAEQFHDNGRYTMSEVPFGVEGGDVFTTDSFTPDITLTGDDLIQFLARNFPQDNIMAEALPGQSKPVTSRRRADDISKSEPRLSASHIQSTKKQESAYSEAIALGHRRQALGILHQALGIPADVDSSIDRDGAHSPSGPDEGAPLYDITRNGVYPEDVYSHNGLRYYSTGDEVMDREAYQLVRSFEAHPNRSIMVYRAVNKDEPGKIEPGAWVTPVRQYAKEHGIGALNGDYKIIKKLVHARDIFTSGDSWLEWGYHPQNFKPELPKGDRKNISLAERINPAAMDESISQSAKRTAAVDQTDTFNEADYRPVVMDWAKTTFGDHKDDNGQPVWQNFVRWFGDSKVVDADGAPLKVFHGTNKDFSEFRNRYAGKSWEMFSDDPAYSGRFTEGDGGNIMPVYLSIQNPLDLSSLPAVRGDVRNKLQRLLERAGVEFKDADLAYERDLFQIINLAGHQTDFRANVLAAGYDGIIMPDTHGELMATSYIALKPEQIKSATGNTGEFNGAKADINQSPRRGQAADQTQTIAFKRWSNDAPLITSAAAASHEFRSGEKVALEAYHGTARPDRVGAIFQKKRATSGPMAYFTSDPSLASNYAQGKQDTSLAEEDSSYANWFKYQPKGQRTAVAIDRAWFSLEPEVKAEVAKRLPDIRLDDDNKVIYKEGGGDIGSYEWNLQQTQRGYDKRGNPLAAAVETWLTSGALFNSEEEFNDVLRLAGMPMKDVTYDSPNTAFPFVYKTWVAMQQPLVTSDMPAEVVDALDAAAAKDRGRAGPEAGAWDKAGRTLREWVQAFHGADSQYVWTMIPDKVTAVFAALGYDGIIDQSGKGGGDQHPVYIPFGEHQVKSALGNSGKFEHARNILKSTEREPSQARLADADKVELRKRASMLKALQKCLG